MTFKPENFTVWTEIPATDLDRAMDFYATVFQTQLTKDESGPNPLAMFPTATDMGVSGHIYPGTPAAEGCGSTIHLACPDKLEDALERVTKAGGKVLTDPITIPPGRFAYCYDTEGNSIGIFAYH